MKACDFVHYFEWMDLPDSFFDFCLSEWAAHGVTRMIFTASQMARCVADPSVRKSFLEKAQAHGIRLSDGHVPWDPEWALNTPEEFRSRMLENNTRALELAAEAGASTLTIHIGDNVCRPESILPLSEARENLDRTLNHLIPVAERCKVVLCVENIIAPTDTPEELVRCFSKFRSSWFGCCFDSGHANVMADFPGKKKENLSPWILDTLWHGKPVLYDGDALADLLPYVVTCHLHDNNGYADQHLLPGRGTVDWNHTMDLLRKAPRLISLQNESSNVRFGLSIPEILASFDVVGALYDSVP